LRAREKGVDRVLVTLRIDAADADASGFEPVKCDGRLVGFVTSGGYGHHVGQSLALAYLDKALVGTGARLTVDAIGESRSALMLSEPAYDPKGMRLRS
jgi:dimethylglycine dehydrogenase